MTERIHDWSIDSARNAPLPALGLFLHVEEEQSLTHHVASLRVGWYISTMSNDRYQVSMVTTDTNSLVYYRYKQIFVQIQVSIPSG